MMVEFLTTFLILPFSLVIFKILQVYRNAYRIGKHFKREQIAGPTWKTSQKCLQDHCLSQPIEKQGNAFFKILKQLSDEYSKEGLFQFWFSSYKPTLVITDPKVANVVLNSTEHLDKAEFYAFLLPILGQSLFTSHKELWQQQKRILQTHFHLSELKQYWKKIERHLVAFNVISKQYIQQNNGRLNDFQPLASAFLIDTIGDNFLDIKFDAQLNGVEPKLFTNFHRLTDYGVAIQLATWPYSFIYHHIIIRIYCLFKHSMMAVAFTKLFWQITAIVNQKFQKLRNNLCLNPDPYPELHVCMLESMIMKSVTQKKIADIADVRSNTLTFLMTSYEPTITSITWLIYLLGTHLDKQNKLREEIDAYLLDLRSKEGQMTLFNVKPLKYLDSCINESLRLYPSAYLIGRHARKEIPLENGIDLPSNMDYIIFIHHIHQNERYFRHAKQFIPERFMMKNDSNDSNETPWLTESAFMPFSAGPRMCIGKEYSLITLKLFVINLLARYRFKVLTDKVVEPEHGFLLKPANFPIEFELRNDNESLITPNYL